VPSLATSVTASSGGWPRGELCHLELIDRVTVWHLALLAFFDDPIRWCLAHDRRQLSTSIISSLSLAMETSFPELKGKEEF